MRASRYALFTALVAVVLVVLPAAGEEAEWLARAAYNADAETVFGQGVERYRRGQYVSARLDFSDVLERYPLNQSSSASHLMLAKALYKLGEYERAMDIAARLDEHFPGSRYLPFGWLVWADAALRLGQTEEAAERYLGLVGIGLGLDLEAMASRHFAVAYEVLDAQTRDALERMTGDRVRRALMLAQAMVPAPAPGSGHSPTAEPPKPEPTVPLPSPPGEDIAVVGVLAPLSGVDAELGAELLDGVRLAYRHWFGDEREGVSLAVGDTQSELVGAVLAAQKLAVTQGLVTVIGPVASPETIAAAGVVTCYGVPLVAPTATQDGITAVGAEVFQLNASAHTEAARLAEYAVEDLGLRAFAVLASLDAWGEAMAANFSDRASELGGRVVATEWYELGTTDFRGQFTRIREAGLAMVEPDTTAEETASDAEPEGAEAFVTTIDGILIAATAEDALQIVSQMTFHGIETQILAGHRWAYDEVAVEGGSYVNGAVVVAGYFDDPGNSALRGFVNSYRQQYGRTPTTVAAFGYDAFSLLAKAYRGGASTGEALASALAEVAGYDGVTGQVSFKGYGRANGDVHFLRITRERFEPLARFARTPSEPARR